MSTPTVDAADPDLTVQRACAMMTTMTPRLYSHERVLETITHDPAWAAIRDSPAGLYYVMAATTHVAKNAVAPLPCPAAGEKTNLRPLVTWIPRAAWVREPGANTLSGEPYSDLVVRYCASTGRAAPRHLVSGENWYRVIDEFLVLYVDLALPVHLATRQLLAVVLRELLPPGTPGPLRTVIRDNAFKNNPKTIHGYLSAAFASRAAMDTLSSARDPRAGVAELNGEADQARWRRVVHGYASATLTTLRTKLTTGLPDISYTEILELDQALREAYPGAHPAPEKAATSAGSDAGQRKAISRGYDFARPEDARETRKNTLKSDPRHAVHVTETGPGEFEDAMLNAIDWVKRQSFHTDHKNAAIEMLARGARQYSGDGWEAFLRQCLPDADQVFLNAVNNITSAALTAAIMGESGTQAPTEEFADER